MQETPLELRAGPEETPTISGYAIRFDAETSIGECFREVVRYESVPDNVQEMDIRALWNHNSDMPLGRTKNGTLTLEKDVDGLRFAITPPDTTWGRDAIESVKRGDVSGMSFGFYTKKDAWINETGQMPLRELLDIEIIEVSPVTFPAYSATSANVRSAEDILQTMPEKQPSPDVQISHMRNQLKIKILEV